MTDERFHHRIREQAKEMATAEIELAQAEARLKKLLAMSKLEAAANGIKTTAAQETYADSLDSVFEARLSVGQAAAKQSAARVELKAREMEFDQWKTEQFMLNREAKRYGA